MISIVGGGLAGLTAANELLKSGFDDFVIFESADRLGGRVETREVQGFRLDKGFQVLNPAYQILDEYIDTDRLELGFFDSGALLLDHNRHNLAFYDPLTHPDKILSVLRGQVFPFSDLVRAGALRLSTLFAKEPSSETENNLHLSNQINEFGFSKKFLDEFLRPFFAGVFLTDEFDIPMSYFNYLFKLFGRSQVGLPKEGMKALPRLLAEKLDASKIELSKPASRVLESGVVEFQDGETFASEAVILATDTLSAHRLRGTDSASPTPKTREVSSFYFSSQCPPWEENLLGLLPWNSGICNHISVQSQAQPSYAPDGMSLICVSTLRGVRQQDEESLAAQILDELQDYKLTGLEDWSLLDTQHIIHALPSQFSCGKASIESERLFIAGDFTETPSIGGAMLSGQKAARRALRQLLTRP